MRERIKDAFIILALAVSVCGIIGLIVGIIAYPGESSNYTILNAWFAGFKVVFIAFGGWAIPESISVLMGKEYDENHPFAFYYIGLVLFMIIDGKNPETSFWVNLLCAYILSGLLCSIIFNIKMKEE